MHQFTARALLLVPALLASALRSPVSADSLVGYWKMENTSGPTVLDSASAGGANDTGTWVGTANYGLGKFGIGLSLTGSNYLNIPNSIDTDKAGEDMTISVWCMVDRWDTRWQTLLAKGEFNRYRIARNASSDSQLSFGGGTGDIRGGSVNDGQWHHVAAVTEDGVETRLYVDGVRVATSTDAPSLGNNGNALLIGANPDAGGREWKGGVDDVGLFDAAFGDVQVATLYSLATDNDYRYDLGKFNALLNRHAEGPGAAPLQIGDDTWTYSTSNPGSGADFFAFSAAGSGMVANGAAISSFTATPAYIVGGQGSVLDWEVLGFSSLTITGGAAPVHVTSLPDLAVSPATTTTYTLTGTHAGGSSTANVTVFVDVPPTVQISATAEFIATGGGTTLHWTSAGADTLGINQGIGDVLPVTDASGQGSTPVTGITSTTTYTITATNPAGTTTDSVTVTTGDPPVINFLTIADPNLVPGATANLSWSITGADSAVISPAVGAVNPVAGTASDTPTATTTYMLTATNAFGPSTATVTATILKAIGIDSAQWTVLHRTSTGTMGGLSDADSLFAGNNVADSATATNVPVINYGPGNSGEFPNDIEPPLGDALDNFAVRATATLIVNFPAEYTFGINNDDGGRLRIGGNNVIVDDTFHGPFTFEESIFLPAGNHTIEYVYFERGGGQAGEVFYVNPDGINEFFEVVAAAPPIPTSGVIINEFMADNDRTLDDFQGDSSDWIELYNGSGATINLAGYYLTDDEAVPSKYPIPAYDLEHGGYLVLFASGKDTILDTDEFHTNFKLATDGEFLGLFKDDGAGGFQVVSQFAPAFPPQVEDASYGTWGAAQELGYMPTPTPGSLNFGGVQGFVGDTHFDIDRGLFSAPFHLTITTDHPAATIRYTLDGSEPTINHGNIHTTAIPIAQTTVVRAAAFLENYAPTNIDTQTYIFPADIPLQDQALAVALGFPSGPVNGQVYQYGMTGGSVTDPEIVQALGDIPTISLVMEQADFSSSATGIFSNADKRGSGWQRPGSIELINEDGLGGGQLQMNCGVRIRGGYSRSDNNPKHAFRLYFSNAYEGDLTYPVFQDEGPRQFEKLDLRTAQNYSWSFNHTDQNTFLREVHGRDAQRDMGQPYTRSRYYHLYINGIYWGLYMSQERSESSYGETYFGGNEDDYDVIKSSGNEFGYTTEATDGDLNRAWRDLWTKVRDLRANPADNAAYFALQGLAADGLSPHPDPVGNPDLLEIDNLADYLLAIFYTGNFDAPLSSFIQASNNWFGIRNRNGPDGFRFFVHDGEHSLGTGANSNNRVGPWGDLHTNRPPSDFTRSNPQYLHEDLAWNEEYRIAFADRVHKHFFNGGAFTPGAVLARLDSRTLEITDAVRAELGRWGNGYTYTTWLNARQDIINFINAGIDGQTTGIGRTAYILDLLRNYNHGGSKPLYPPVHAPVFSMNGGAVPFGFGLQMTNPNSTGGTLYYTTDGSDPRLAGGTVNPAAGIATGTVHLTHSGPVKARVLDVPTSTWSALNNFEFIVGVAGSANNLVVSEVHYNPASTPADTFPNRDDYEFIELLNLSATDPVELTGTRFSAGIAFDFTASNVIQLAPGARVVVVRNLAAFTERYPGVSPDLVAGEFTGNLDNSGERITLLDATNAAIKDFTYNDSLPWPTAADGEGYSLVLNIDQSNPDHNTAIHWRSHATRHGNPGGPDGSSLVDWTLDHALTGTPGADTDHDTIPDVFEYAAGTDPNDPASATPLGFRSSSYYVDGVFQDFPSITVRRNLAAGDILYYPEVSSDLVSWSSSATDLVMVAMINQGDGTELVTWRTALPVSNPGGEQLFIRLRIDGE